VKEKKGLNKDQTLGATILVGSIVGILIYGWLLYIFPIIVLQVSAFVAAAGVLGLLAWIGWTMATTPPLEPIEPEVTTTASEEETSKPSEAPRG
jgi:predicted DNA-binding transcriptional regulator